VKDGRLPVFWPRTDLAFRGNEIIHCGTGYDGPADIEIDGCDRMVMLSLVNVHSHPMSEPMNKWYNEELGSPTLGMSGLYEYMLIFRPDQPGTPAGAEVAYCELLLSGLRVAVAPMFCSGHWDTPNGHEVLYEWDEAAGRSGMDQALKLTERSQQDANGRLGGMLTPSQSIPAPKSCCAMPGRP
jgi:5-methylthioadenosine/S-adenosylhomocysteine deaminase